MRQQIPIGKYSTHNTSKRSSPTMYLTCRSHNYVSRLYGLYIMFFSVAATAMITVLHTPTTASRREQLQPFNVIVCQNGHVALFWWTIATTYYSIFTL